MSNDTKDAGGDIAPTRFSLSRWSERKRAIARGEAVAEAPPVPVADAAAPAAGAPAVPEPPLPHVDSLTFDSDFSVFMTGNVDPAVRRAALRTLLHDPRFNVMDGLDVYIDDYSIPDPISPEILAQLRHSIAVLNPVFPADDHAPQLARDGDPASASDERVVAAHDRQVVETNDQRVAKTNDQLVVEANDGHARHVAAAGRTEAAEAGAPASAAVPLASPERHEHEAGTS
jgi:hypothetical protein